MASLGGLVKFLVGGAAGTAVGLAVTSLLAPQKGTEFQAATQQRIADAKSAGAEAEAQAEQAVRERFRQRVGDSGAPRAGDNGGRLS